MPRPPVTVVVPCRDRPGLLDRCLDHLAPQLGEGDEVVVADSASASPEVGAVARRHGVRLVRCEQPGASRARNAGWRAAAAPVVAFVDDDVLVDPGWLDALTAALDDPGTGFAVGRTALPVGHDLAGPGATVTSVEPPAVITPRSTGVYGAGNLAVPRAVLARVGGFDERLGPGRWLAAGEDVEMLDRVLALGLVGRYAPGAVGRHEQWRTAAAARRLQWVYGLGMGARVAAAFRRQPRAGMAMLGELLRLGGLRTAARRLRPGRRRPGRAGSSTTGGPPDVSGWRGPLLWRLGGLVGFAVGLVRLAPHPVSCPEGERS